MKVEIHLELLVNARSYLDGKSTGYINIMCNIGHNDNVIRHALTLKNKTSTERISLIVYLRIDTNLWGKFERTISVKNIK